MLSCNMKFKIQQPTTPMQDTNNGKLRAGGEGVSLSVLPAQFFGKAKTALKIKFIN